MSNQSHLSAPGRTLPAIDVHAHYGHSIRRQFPVLDEWLSADADEVAKRAHAAGIVLTVVSPLSGLMPRGEADAVAANEESRRTVRRVEGLGQWVIIHPDQRATFEQAAIALREPQCFGIKLHPEEHCYPIRDKGAELFAFAAEHNATVLVHSGDPNSWPADFIPFANDHPNVCLILAHLGNGGGAAGDPTLQVRAIQSSRHANVYVDTSSSRSIMPGLLEWSVREIGADRILFGTDTPLYSVAMQRARVDSAEISPQDRRRILYGNACKLLGIPDHVDA